MALDAQAQPVTMDWSTGEYWNHEVQPPDRRHPRPCRLIVPQTCHQCSDEAMRNDSETHSDVAYAIDSL